MLIWPVILHPNKSQIFTDVCYLVREKNHKMIYYELVN